MALLALWNPNIQFLKTDGTINAGGKLVVTDHNDAESVPANYSDADGTTLNSSPIILDALGRATCYIDDRSTYDLYVKDANGATLWTVPEMTPGAETIVVRAGFSVSSNDSSVAVVISVDPNGVTSYDLSIQDEIDRAEGAEGALAEDIADEIDRAKTAEKAAKTEVVAGDNITVTKAVGADGQDVYTIDGEDGGNEGVFGVYTRSGNAWNKSSGDADIANLEEGNYHYTLVVGYSVGTPSNTIATIDSDVGSVMHRAPVDCSFIHTGWVEFSGDFYGTALNPTLTFPTGVSLYPAAYLFVHSTAGGGGGSGANNKVAVEAGAVAGFLKDVLVSASDMVSLVPSGNRLLVNVNLDYSSDPKLTTMDESQVDGATSNYGGYQLKSGVEKLQWGDDTFQSFDWLNAEVYQCMRLSDAQGTITKCNVALCGSLGFQSPAPCFNVGIFDAQTGTLLGQSGLKFYGEDFSSDEEMCEVDMVEASEGSLTIKRNMRYIIQVWTCGLQLAALDRSTNYNYTYDYTLRQNLQTTTSLPKFVDVTSAMSRASTIPLVSFGAESLV